MRDELKKKAVAGIKPSEAMMREYYAGNEKTFIHPAKAIVQHIVIPIKDKKETVTATKRSRSSGNWPRR